MKKNGFPAAVLRTLNRKFLDDDVTVQPASETVAAVPEHGLVFFSQFGEDAVLRGYFRRREERRRLAGKGSGTPGSPVGTGFFVDVGCYHPTRYSNTYHLYLQGWRGLNIDPTPGTCELFDQARPNDATIECAVSDQPGELTFYGPGGRSVFNTLSKEQADEYVKAGWFKEYKTSTVPARTLADILDEHLPTGQTIDLLDVDVEGHDVQVLRSNDWSKYRPEVVLVECHSQRFRDILEDERSRLLLDKGYEIHAWVPPNVLFRASP